MSFRAENCSSPLTLLGLSSALQEAINIIIEKPDAKLRRVLNLAEDEVSHRPCIIVRDLFHCALSVFADTARNYRHCECSTPTTRARFSLWSHGRLPTVPDREKGRSLQNDAVHV